ncbi:hypothetical protein C8Q74DRAFT_941235 [Fomes fomentarius]|nr:hypothetical protein C8Q74DRAFT_941235 [Fomes fomentarius]
MVDTSRLAPPTPQEIADIAVLDTMWGGSLDTNRALALLRKHGNNLDRTATALIEGETGDPDDFSDLPHLEPLEAPVIGPGPRTPPPSRPENPVIDLTRDDDPELTRALRESLESSTATSFGPSNRAPDPNWAMVPSNVEAGAPSGMSSDDQAMSRAIEASLSYSVTEDTYHELPLHERIRHGDTPVALRPTLSNVAYAALIVHGLFFVPQFRHAIAGWLPMPLPGTDEFMIPTSGTALQVWTLLEILANMDLARLSELNVDAALNAFAADPWASPGDRPGDVSTRFYEKLNYAVENVLRYNNAFDLEFSFERQPRRLMSFQYGEHDTEPGESSPDNLSDLSVVRVSVRSNPWENDLVSSLAAELAPPDTLKLKTAARRHVIFEPSEIIAFQLLRDALPPSYDAAVGRKSERAVFKYPKSVYLDQFMRESYELASAKRAEQRTLLAEVTELETRRKNLLHHNDKDTLADLQSCLYYHEHVAESNDDPKRAEEILTNKEKLARTIDKIQEEVKAIDSTIERSRTEAQSKLDCPELQKHRYDLRVVMVHDGLYGRSHLYSHVKQKGKWWKTVDYSVSEVTEEAVLNDSTGFHLGAGPYFLIYSRAVSQEEEDARAEWPSNIKDSVKYNNRTFFEQLPPEIAAEVVDPNSPPSSPYVPPTPSEHTISSDTVEPPESRDELMDTTD